MSKIVQAANVMVSNPALISDVLFGSAEPDEVFFTYKSKYKWSITKNEDSNGCHLLHYYPSEDISIEALAAMDNFDWNLYNQIVTYSSQEIGSKEAKETFSELYTITIEKQFGMDTVLDDIISDDIFF
jgi:hypothetical protein